MLLTIITFIIVLSILVFVHEMGHFYMARKFGVKAEEFGFGFPPRAWGIYKKAGVWKKVVGSREVKDADSTIYSINWLPLGGFVKIKGEDGDGSGDKDSFASQPIWKRAFILLAGVAMNIVLAVVLISVGYMIGLPEVIEDVHPSAVVSNQQVQIVEVLKDTPADKAGLKIGDFVETVDGNEFREIEKISAYVENKAGEKVVYEIKRGQDIMTLDIVPEIIKETGVGGIGIGIVETGLVRLPIWLAVTMGVKTTFYLIGAIVSAFYSLIKNIGQGVSADIAGPVGIAAITGQVARMGFVYILQFTALLSVNLAILNALPFPALDGGRILFLIIEKIKGSPVKREIEALVHNIGFAFLMLLVLLVTFKDISRFSEGLKMFWDRIIG